MYKQFVVFLWLLFPTLLPGQFSLEAQVKDSVTQAPVAYASISLLTALDSSFLTGVISDENGRFNCIVDNDGDYLLSVQVIGYESLVCRHKAGADMPAIIYLSPTAVELREVAVTAKRSTLRTELGKRTFYVGQDLMSSGSSLSNVLEQLPSTEVDAEGNISVRGSSNVLIYINGKESKRDGRSLSDLPADLIEKVELITNPSAQYDAEGVAGILNIVYRKNKTAGPRLRLSGELGFPYRAQVGFQSSYKTPKLNLFLNTNYRYSTSQNSYRSVRENTASDSTFLNEQISTSVFSALSFNAGVEWSPDSSSQISLEGEYFRWVGEETIDFRNQLNEERVIVLDNYASELEDEFELSLQYQKDFAGEEHTLNTILTYGGEVEGNTEDFNRQRIDVRSTPLASLLSASEVDETQRLASAVIDYQYPLSSVSRLAIGGKSQYVYYDILQQIDFNDSAFELPDNDFEVTQWQHALYGTYSRRWKSLEIGVGARLENFASKARQQSIDSSFQRNAARLFPSAQISWQITESQSVGATYSKRIQRPGFFDLNPFVYFTDPLNLSTGNPFLLPELSDALELNYALTAERFSFNLTLFRRATANSIQMAVFQDGPQTITRPLNFSTATNAGIELNARTTFFDKWTVSAQSSIFQNSFTSNDDDLILQNQQSSWRIRLGQTLELPGETELQFTAFYRSPRFNPPEYYAVTILRGRSHQ